MKLDVSTPGAAARVNFAAAWLFCETSMMNAANAQFVRTGMEEPAYGSDSYVAAQESARAIAEGRCNGDHDEPECADVECWQREEKQNV